MYHTPHYHCFRPVNLALPIIGILLAFAAVALLI